MPELRVITATGKRKTAVARVRLKPGTGQILVNGRPMTEYFPREVLHMRIQSPFEVSNAEGLWDVSARVAGGGIAGQADALRHGISLSIPESAKPGLYARIRRILQADNLAAALAGIVILAGLVNLIELLCTAGFPALYTQILTLHQMPEWEYYSYLGLYNLAYIFDDSLMVTIAVVTLSRRKLQERSGRWLKLTSGLVMVGLSAVLLLQPEWLI